MKKKIEVRSQAEFDACVKAGNIAIVIDCSVEARDNSSVIAWDNSSVIARDNSSVIAWDNSSVEAWGNSSVIAWGNSSVIARENSSVIARENSSVIARENSSVVAWGNSSVVAWGNVFIRLFSALKIKASTYVTIVKHNKDEIDIKGGRIMDSAPEPKTGKEFCEFNGIDDDAPFKVENIDVKILEAIKAGNGSLNMKNWHDDKCNEDNWCGTSHCRAGYAICLAGKDGFDLEKKYGSELAGRMIYAVSRPEEELPDFYADNDVVFEELEKRYSKFYESNRKEVTLKLTDEQLEEIKKQYDL